MRLLRFGFPALLLATVAVAIENMIHTRGINRIRHYYVELAPDVARYFIHSTHDDVAGALQGMGIVPSKWQHFVTNAGMVSVINSVLAGVFAGMVAEFTTPLPIYGVIAVGLGVVALTVAAQHRYQLSKYAEIDKGLETLFPSDAPR